MKVGRRNLYSLIVALAAAILTRGVPCARAGRCSASLRVVRQRRRRCTEGHYHTGTFPGGSPAAPTSVIRR